MKRKILSIILFLLGLGLCSYPLISNIISRVEQTNTIGTYEDEIKDNSDEVFQQYLADAENYNKALVTWENGIVGEQSEDMLSYEYYNSLLNLSGNGIMGSIEIPRIDVNIPIYHGTEEEVLSIGVGHIYGSSLPVGGSDTHSLLTSHSGMPNAKLFTRLDELEVGDFFHVKVCNSAFTYEVCNIQVIKPEELDSLNVQEGRDLISLITCTPYGINTHRLIVTGERADYTESIITNVDSLFHTMSLRELIFTILPFVFAAIAVTSGIKHRKGRKQSEEKN